MSRAIQSDKFILNIHIITNSFTLLLRGDLQTIQHITVKDTVDDNNFIE